MVQKLLRLDWGRPLGSQPLPRSLTLLLIPPRAWWWDLNTIDIVLWLQDIASRQTDVVEGRAAASVSLRLGLHSFEEIEVQTISKENTS
ncbi:hypothetical protein AAFF_G00367630 [Aldrovandia affinis]|uniref:Uncharacterized protein n=1 Tax=Aldrovandia affinis TaxID=143900 RepID=A0AAD7R4Z4_9TELE|nr:hypothetical protein AAFF_G00367630 [Aldrovandia affinis]